MQQNSPLVANNKNNKKREAVVYNCPEYIQALLLPETAAVLLPAEGRAATGFAFHTSERQTELANVPARTDDAKGTGFLPQRMSGSTEG